MDLNPNQKNSQSVHATETGDKHWPDGPLGLYADMENSNSNQAKSG